jgi:hypothetical protein
MPCTHEQRANATIAILQTIGLEPLNRPQHDHWWFTLVSVGETLNGVWVESARVGIPDSVADWWCNHDSLTDPPIDSAAAESDDISTILRFIVAKVALEAPDNIDVTDALVQWLAQDQ